MRLLVIFIFLQASSICNSKDACIVKTIESIYSFENEKTVINRKDSLLKVTFYYSDKNKNIKGEKIIIIDGNEKRYQFESYYTDLIINPKKHHGLMNNFGKGKWINIDFIKRDAQANSLAVGIYHCEYVIKN
jgi:hypothetical protein